MDATPERIHALKIIMVYAVGQGYHGEGVKWRSSNDEARRRAIEADEHVGIMRASDFVNCLWRLPVSSGAVPPGGTGLTFTTITRAMTDKLEARVAEFRAAPDPIDFLIHNGPQRLQHMLRSS